MEHYQKTIIEPKNVSTSKFGVRFEHQFVVLDDAKHLIAIDARNGNYLILENIVTGKADKFRWRDFDLN